VDSQILGPEAALKLLRGIGRDSLSLGRIVEGHMNALQLVARYAEPHLLAAAARDVVHFGQTPVAEICLYLIHGRELGADCVHLHFCPVGVDNCNRRISAVGPA
jgi:hypothetical protein